MHTLVRHSVALTLVAAFVLLATIALDKPGYYYDEVIHIPVALRALGDCEVDAAVTQEIGCFPLLQTLGYVGAVKAWLAAPIIAAFGINTWSVRLPPILVAAIALLVLASFVRRELGVTWSVLLLLLLAGDPVLLNHARLDWGPQMIALLLRVVSLAALVRWLQTGRLASLVVVGACFLLGLVDKVNFIWVIGAWLAATATVLAPTAWGRLRAGAPWQPLVAGVTLLLLLWGALALIRPVAGLDIQGDAGTLTASAQVTKVWQLYAATFSGLSVIGWVFGAPVPVTAAFNVLLLVQLVAAVALLAWCRPWTPARRLLAFLTAATFYLLLAIGATRQVGGTHHLFMLWPMPTLHLVTLVAVAAQRLGTERGRGMALRSTIALGGIVAGGTLLAWNVAMDLRYADIWRHDRDFRPLFDPAIRTLGERLHEIAPDRVISVDWGLHQPLVTLAGRERARDYREWTWRLIDAKDDPGRADLQRAIARDLTGKRVAFVLHGPGFAVIDGARARLDALMAATRPCHTSEEGWTNASGRTIYTIVIADYASCRPPPRVNQRNPRTASHATIATMMASETQRIHGLLPGARPAPTATTAPVSAMAWSAAATSAAGATRALKRAKKSSAIFAAAASMSREPICAILPPTLAATT